MKFKNIVISLLSATLLLHGCSSKDELPESTAGGQTGFTQTQKELAGIKTGSVEYRLLSSVVSCTGEVEVPPQGMASVAAPLGGYISGTEIVPGKYVKRGEVLARLANPEYIVLQQSYLETSGQLKFAEQEYLRQKTLQEQNATAEKRMQESESAFTVLKARLAGLKAQLKLIGINMREIENGSIQEVVYLRSPIAGYVTAVNHHPGEFVEPRDAIFEIVNMEELHLHLNVFEQDIARVNHGQTIRFSPTSDNRQQYIGAVSLVSPKRSMESRSFDVHGHIESGQHMLKPGMYIEAEILVSADTVPSVPQGAIVRDGNASFVLIEQNGDYTPHAVETGVKMDGWVEVVNHQGLGQRNIVTQGASRLFAAIKRSE
jgi:membrane fusion protein, heavy metal efflux system